MRKLNLILTFALLLTPLLAFAPPNLSEKQPNKPLSTPEATITPVDQIERTWRAMCQIESSNRPRVINKKEKAYGIVQIRQTKLNDYYRLTGTRYTLKEMLDTIKAREVWQYYADKHNVPEKIARKWNGSGPKTTTYWNRVKKHL